MSTKAIKDALEAIDATPDVVPGTWAVDATMHLSEFAPEDVDFIRECSPWAIRALLAELEEAKRDAARYRFLRDDMDSDWAICEWDGSAYDGAGFYRDARASHVVDAAIDEAIAAAAINKDTK